MDEPVLTNSIYNKLGRLSKGWGKHTGTDTMEFIFHKDKPKDRRSTYVKAVCNIIPQKMDTQRTRLAAGGNLKDNTGEVST